MIRPAGRGSENTWVKLSGACKRDGGIPLRTQDEQAVIPEEVREVGPENHLRCLEIRGVVDRVEEDPDLDFINSLFEKYLGVYPYQNHRRGDEWVVVFVRPEHATSKDG